MYLHQGYALKLIYVPSPSLPFSFISPREEDEFTELHCELSRNQQDVNKERRVDLYPGRVSPASASKKQSVLVTADVGK